MFPLVTVELLIVLAIAALAAFLTYLGAPLAERYPVPQWILGLTLQFAAGVITALVAFSLMPPAVRAGQPVVIVLAFFLGGALYVAMEELTGHLTAARSVDSSVSVGIYTGVLVDMLIDGVVIGIGSTLSLRTGLVLALGIAISTLPLAFVTTATAMQRGVPPEQRRVLSLLFIVCIVGGALLGYLLLRNQPESVRMVLVALASGFLVTLVTQGLIPEANRNGEPRYAGIFYLTGLSIYALLSLTA